MGGPSRLVSLTRMAERAEPTAVHLASATLEAMVAWAKTCLPAEACGLFTGQPGGRTIDVFHPTTNTAASAEIYVIDGREMLDIEAAAEAAGTEVLGVMHSHPHTEAYPSTTDIADAARFDPFGVWIFVIVSLALPEPATRAFSIRDGAVTEHELVVVA